MWGWAMYPRSTDTLMVHMNYQYNRTEEANTMKKKFSHNLSSHKFLKFLYHVSLNNSV